MHGLPNISQQVIEPRKKPGLPDPDSSLFPLFFFKLLKLRKVEGSLDLLYGMNFDLRIH